MSTGSTSPKRGEVWLVALDPTRGAEIQKTRPAIILSSDHIGKLPLRIVVPITEWKEHYSDCQWHVKVEPNKTNGLNKVSSVDALQIRSIDTQRLVKRLGSIPLLLLDEINAALVSIIEYQ